MALRKRIPGEALKVAGFLAGLVIVLVVAVLGVVVVLGLVFQAMP